MTAARVRATKAEMEERAEFLIDYASEHGPVTVRGLYYQAEVASLPGISKDDNDYAKVQRQVLKLRRVGRLSYSNIADATRWMRKPTTHDSVEEALRDTARFYRKALWADADSYVEIWVEKDALAGVIYPITSLYDVPLMVTRGFSSETFAYEAIAAREGDDRAYYVYALVDFDRAGRDGANSLQEKLERFADEEEIDLVFQQRDKDGLVIATIEHAKDGKDGTRFASKLEQVELGKDTDSDPITSCVIVETETEPARPKLPKTQQFALDALKKLLASNESVVVQAGSDLAKKGIPIGTRVCHSEDWRAEFYDTYPADKLDTKKKALLRATLDLTNEGLILLSGQYVWQRDIQGKSSV